MSKSKEVIVIALAPTPGELQAVTRPVLVQIFQLQLVCKGICCTPFGTDFELFVLDATSPMGSC